MKILEVKKYSDQILEDVNTLIPQLSKTAKPISSHRLKAIISSQDIHLFLAEEEELIIGSLTLVMIRIPTCIKAQIEDVIVDEKYLGKGLGKQLTLHAINFSKENGASLVNLTCSPWRKAANELYKKLGFVRRDTNVYKLDV